MQTAETGKKLLHGFTLPVAKIIVTLDVFMQISGLLVLWMRAAMPLLLLDTRSKKKGLFFKRWIIISHF